MPRTIKSKREVPKIILPQYECPADVTVRVKKPIPPLFDYNQTPAHKSQKILFVQSLKQSICLRCNRAVQLAEKEWNPDKTYETNGENRGDDITRYRYGQDNDFAWCASFFNYLYNPNHVDGQNVFGMSDKDVISTQKILAKAKESGCFSPAKNEYIPQVGDALIWKNDNDDMKGHIGIIVEVREDGSFVTIQGNNNDKVEKIEYQSIDDAMTRVNSSGNNQTLQGFVQMSKYYEQHNLVEAVADENNSLSSDSNHCWLS